MYSFITIVCKYIRTQQKNSGLFIHCTSCDNASYTCIAIVHIIEID